MSWNQRKSSSMVGFSDPPPPPPPRPTGATTIPIGSHGGSRNAGKEVVDPLTQGFDMMREWFERLESRLGRPNPRVAGPVVTEVQDPATTGQPFGEDDDWEMDNRDLGFRRNYFGDDRNPTVGLRNHPSRNRRDYTAPPAGFRGRGDRHQIRRGGPDVDRRDQRRQRTNWDPAPRYREEWDDEEPWADRGPTTWAPPPRRGGYDRQYHEPPHARSNSSRYSTRRNAYRPPGVLSDYYEPPHGHSTSSRYSARQDAYQSTRNAFTSRDQFVELERPLRQPHCSRQSPNSGWFSPESHQQQFRHAIKQTCWDPSSQTSGRRVGEICAPPLPEPPPKPTPPDLLCQQLQNRIQRPTFPSSRTPTRPQLVLDQKPPLQSDRLLTQPRTTSTIELPPYAAPSPCQPLLLLSVKAPSCASPHQLQAGVSSSRINEWEIHSHNGEKKREEKLFVLTSLWNQREKNKENDYMAKREEGVNNTYLKLLEKENTVEALRSALATEENDFIVLTKKPSKRECMEIQNLVDDNKDGFDMKKQDSQVEIEEKRRLFEDVLKLKAEELGKIGDAHTGSQALVCVYVSLNVSDVPNMNPRLPSLDADARWIPPRNNKPCCRIPGVCGTLGAYSSFRPKSITSGRVKDHEFDYEENLGLLQLALHVPHAEMCKWRRSPFDDHISPSWLIFDGGDEGRSSVVRYPFDPGGDVSPKHLISTLFVASRFPP